MKPFAQLANLNSRTALVTGAAGGVGEAIVEVLAELGCHVVLTDRDEGPIKDRAEQLQQKGFSASWATTDLSDWSSTSAALDDSLASFDSIDILVNNAAYVGTSGLEGWVEPFVGQNADLWARVLELNLTVPFRLSQYLNERLLASEGGSIINISSIYGALGPDMHLYQNTAMGNPAAYAASKGGLIQTTRWLATTIAPVRVNAIALGGIQRGQPASFQEKYCARTPLKRMGKEEDIKGAIAFLASDMSAYITGQILFVDGGWSAW